MGLLNQVNESQWKNIEILKFAIKSFDKAICVATYKTFRQASVRIKGILIDTGKRQFNINLNFKRNYL